MIAKRNNLIQLFYSGTPHLSQGLRNDMQQNRRSPTRPFDYVIFGGPLETFFIPSLIRIKVRHLIDLLTSLFQDFRHYLPIERSYSFPFR